MLGLLLDPIARSSSTESNLCKTCFSTGTRTRCSRPEFPPPPELPRGKTGLGQIYPRGKTGLGQIYPRGKTGLGYFYPPGHFYPPPPPIHMYIIHITIIDNCHRLLCIIHMYNYY